MQLRPHPQPSRHPKSTQFPEASGCSHGEVSIGTCSGHSLSLPPHQDTSQRTLRNKQDANC